MKEVNIYDFIEIIFLRNNLNKKEYNIIVNDK